MNRQLKQDIDTLFDGSADETRAAQKRLGLEPVSSARRPDFSQIENAIWQKYETTASVPAAANRGGAKLLRGRWPGPVVAAAATALLAVGTVIALGFGPQLPNTVRFDHTHAGLSNYTFQQKLQLGLRHAEGLEIKSQGQNFRLGARSIWGRFEFEKKPGNSLVIETPRGTFSVTGTRFILKANAERAQLLVEEGSVKVEQGGHTQTVTANRQYIDDGKAGVVRELSTPEREVFGSFMNSEISNDALVKSAEKATRRLRSVTVSVELFDGNRVSGELLSESAEALVIKPKNFQAITVKKTEIKSSTRK